MCTCARAPLHEQHLLFSCMGREFFRVQSEALVSIIILDTHDEEDHFLVDGFFLDRETKSYFEVSGATGASLHEDLLRKSFELLFHFFSLLRLVFFLQLEVLFLQWNQAINRLLNLFVGPLLSLDLSPLFERQ